VTENSLAKGHSYHLPFDGSAEVEASEASFCCLALSIAPEVEAPADDEDESPAK